MRAIWLAAAATLLSPQLAVAQGAASAPDRAKMERDAKNWETLHSMYPKSSLAAREQGLVGFKIGIDAAGSPTRCEVTHTSGFKTLDEETCKLIMVHATFKRPEGISLSQTRTYEGVVNWKLPDTPLAAVPEVPRAVVASAAPEPQICKRTPRIGTLAAFERTCMTQREWDKQTSETREYWDELQGRKGATREGM